MNGGKSNPAEVFDIVSNRTRVEILQVLVNTYSNAPHNPWLEYNELREAVGIRDNGNLNYHLNQLDSFLVKGPSGYRISRIGMEVISAVSSGVFDPNWTWGPIDAPGDCLFCGDSLQLDYEDGILRLTCDTGEHSIPLSIPPSLLEAHPEEDLIERIAFMENHWGALTRQGICTECQGYVDGELENNDGHNQYYHYHGHCHRCGFQHGIPVGMFLISHPAVANFYYEHGVDIRTTPFWTLEFCTPGNERVASTDPLRLRVEVNHDGETLALTLDQTGSVITTNRSSQH